MDPIINIVRIDLITEETTPVTHKLVDVFEEATAEPRTNEGEEVVKRVNNKILAQEKKEDITIGFDLGLKSAILDGETVALVDGGTWDSVTKKYTAPAAGTVVSRKKFTTVIYTEEKDNDGDVIGYVKFSFPGGKGKPIGLTFNGTDFVAPELSIRTAPGSGAAPWTFEELTALPA